MTVTSGGERTCRKRCTKTKNVGSNDAIAQFIVKEDACKLNVCLYAHDQEWKRTTAANEPLQVGCISNKNQRCRLCSYDKLKVRSLLPVFMRVCE